MRFVLKLRSRVTEKERILSGKSGVEARGEKCGQNSSFQTEGRHIDFAGSSSISLRKMQSQSNKVYDILPPQSVARIEPGAGKPGRSDGVCVTRPPHAARPQPPPDRENSDVTSNHDSRLAVLPELTLESSYGSGEVTSDT